MTKKQLREFVDDNGSCMIECRDKKVFLLLNHWHYLKPIKEAKRVLLGKLEFKPEKQIMYVYQNCPFLS